VLMNITQILAVIVIILASFNIIGSVLTKNWMALMWQVITILWVVPTMMCWRGL